MFLSPETIFRFIQNPKEYLFAFVVFILFMLVTISVTKSNKNETH
jgi:hypothetical protein